MDFLDQFEMKEYLKNLLILCEFDEMSLLERLDKKSLESMEEFVQKNLSKDVRFTNVEHLQKYFGNSVGSIEDLQNFHFSPGAQLILLQKLPEAARKFRKRYKTPITSVLKLLIDDFLRKNCGPATSSESDNKKPKTQGTTSALEFEEKIATAIDIYMRKAVVNNYIKVTNIEVRLDPAGKIYLAKVLCPYCSSKISLTIDKTRGEPRPVIGNFTRHLKIHLVPVDQNQSSLDSFVQGSSSSHKSSLESKNLNR